MCWIQKNGDALCIGDRVSIVFEEEEEECDDEVCFDSPWSPP